MEVEGGDEVVNLSQTCGIQIHAVFDAPVLIWGSPPDVTSFLLSSYTSIPGDLRPWVGVP